VVLFLQPALISSSLIWLLSSMDSMLLIGMDEKESYSTKLTSSASWIGGEFGNTASWMSVEFYKSDDQVGKILIRKPAIPFKFDIPNSFV
jgi:hypothetical protein